MNEILHANVFFVIASVATVLFTIIVCLVLFQVYRLVQSVRRIAQRIELASEQVAADMTQARALLYNGGILARVLGFIAGTRRPTRRGQAEEKED